jgi:hypothetical protein
MPGANGIVDTRRIVCTSTPSDEALAGEDEASADERETSCAVRNSNTVAACFGVAGTAPDA